jgi:hypothetical protein
MKRLSEYTKKELISLTPEQRHDLIDLECANEGVRLLPEKPIKPEKTGLEKDITYFELAGTVKFANRKEIITIVDTINKCELLESEYLMRYDYDHRYLKKSDKYVSFEQCQGYSEETLLKIKDRKKQYDKDIEDYEKSKNEYSEILKKQIKISAKVDEKIREAGREHELIKALRREYNRYLQLSEGDRKIAFNFLLDGRSDQKELIEKLKHQIAMEVVINSAGEIEN